MTGSNDDYGLGAATGPFGAPFISVGFYMIAVRGSFGGFGDKKAGGWTLDFGMKLPMAVRANGLKPIDIVPLDASH
jgi:hypothetical protein